MGLLRVEDEPRGFRKGVATVDYSEICSGSNAINVGTTPPSPNVKPPTL